jgi:predicted transcriptional regulator
MPKRQGTRYTPQQKEKMRQKALDMRARGVSQKAIAEELGVAVATLTKLLKGEVSGGKTGGGARAVPNDSPVMQMESKRRRLQEIAAQMQALSEEEEQLRNEMRELYEKLGTEIFGQEKGA